MCDVGYETGERHEKVSSTEEMGKNNGTCVTEKQKRVHCDVWKVLGDRGIGEKRWEGESAKINFI